MSLFNLIFTRNLKENLYDNTNHTSISVVAFNYKVNRKHVNHLISYSYQTASTKRESIHDIHGDPKNLAVKKLVSRNFITYLFNKYWQETIFLSTFNISSNNYINQLTSDSLNTSKNQYKKFLLSFNKALINGRIEFSDFTFDVNNNVSSVKYVWKKGFNLAYPKNFSLFRYGKKRNTGFPDKVQLSLMKKLKYSGFPIFTIVNRFHQIVMAEPSDILLKNNNFLDTIFQWYYNNFIWTKDIKPIYEGLLFINPEDASEYMRYIKYKYPNSSRQNFLNLFISRLDFYYKLVRIAPPKVQFRLIPDLQEVGELIYKYRYKKNIIFHNKQMYGKDYFQGQPIYLIQPVSVKNKQTKKIDSISYSYGLYSNNLKYKYETIFMNYDTALIAWKKFREELSDYNLPYVPQIIVYNLEDFLHTCEQNNQIDNKNFLFIPSQETYNFIKHKRNKKSPFIISQILSSKILHIKLFTQRMFWSLTSRQPMYW